MSEVYVGIDPSIGNTGAVCIDANGNLVDFMNGRDAYPKGYKRPEYDILHFQVQISAIADMLGKYTVRAMAYEGYSMGSIHRAFSLAEYGGMLKSVLHGVTGTIPHIIPPNTLKKFATGNGRAEKKDMIERALLDCPALGELDKKQLTSDICDAYFLARLALSTTTDFQSSSQ